MESHYCWKKELDRQNHLEFVVLGYCPPTSSQDALEAWIAPGRGANLCRFSLGGKHIIDFAPDLLAKSDYTGTPVLYPTPNRVRNGVFTFRGKAYPQEKRGVKIFEHGLVHSEPWDYSDPEVKGDSISMRAWIDFDPASLLYPAFPFEHRLALEFNLTASAIQVRYRIENKSGLALPFGFGLHPYFQKLSGDENTFVSLPTRHVMDATSDLLPTGRLIDVAGTIYDLRQPVKLGALDLDHVFTGVAAGQHARVDYATLGWSVHLEASDDFSHLVLYSPRGEAYFCLENQTCSTDAHNLAERGFKVESGLKVVESGQTHSGSVTYRISKE